MPFYQIEFDTDPYWLIHLEGDDRNDAADFAFCNQYLTLLPTAVLANLFVFVPRKIKEILQVQIDKTENIRSYGVFFKTRPEKRTSKTICHFKHAISGEATWARDTTEFNKKWLPFFTFIDLGTKTKHPRHQYIQSNAELLLMNIKPSTSSNKIRLTSALISTPMKNFKDSAGRVFEEPLSAYGYAFLRGKKNACKNICMTQQKSP